VLELLAKYLYQYKQLYIPGIGSFEVVEQPARLEYADRLIYPPVAEIRYSEGGTLKDTQLEYLEDELGTDRFTIENKLQLFGQDLKQRLNGTPFEWPGLGILNCRQNKIVFQAAAVPGLAPVEAHKVIRENAQHMVLIGEQEVRSGDVAEYLNGASRKRSVFVLIGWVLLALAILFIIYYFYQEGLKPESSGSKVKAVAALSIQPVWFN
jgi:hypothetical protein